MTLQDYDMIKSFEGFALYRCWNKKEDTEDLMQDVILKILRNKNFDQMGEIEKRKYVVWLIKNKSIDLRRGRNIPKRRGINISLFYENGTLVCGPEIEPEVYSKIELKEVLQQSKENKVCESLMLLVSGYKNKEIAMITGKSINTVVGRCRYARQYLMKQHT